MASTKQDITYLFSRRLNGLAEKQRWWPAHITDKSGIGITVDPMLFNTNFGPSTIEDEGRGKATEANTAGVRVECLNIDGTAPSGTPTIQIIDSGTLNARCVVTHPDGTKTEWRFVAPSADSQVGNGYGTQIGTGAGSMNPSSTSPLPAEPSFKTTAGPYPVFATLQDFIDWLDGLSNSWSKFTFDTYWAGAGGMAQEAVKSAWLPHGLLGDIAYGGSTAASAAWPNAENDPRIAAGNADALPTTGLYIATMFQPLLYDNNQLSYSSDNANTDIVKGIYDQTRPLEDGSGSSGAYFNFYNDGMTRYSQQPQEPADNSGYPQIDTIDGGSYKWFKNSGDFKNGKVGSFQKVDTEENPNNVFDYVNWDIDPSSSAYGGPSYRMRTALACFLKDGTYSLSGGSLIPYVYDPNRTIGGADGTTCYAVWNGKGGRANTAAELNQPVTDLSQSAQIFPLFDFLQGPVSPAGQGWNYDWDSISSNYINWPFYAKYANEQFDAYTNGNTGDTNTGGATGTSSNTMRGPVTATRRQQPRSGLVRPNPTRAPLYAISQSGAGTSTTITTSGDCAGLIEIWVEDNNVSATKVNYWREGMPVVFQTDGVLGGLQINGVNQYLFQKGPNAITTWVKGTGSSLTDIQFGTATSLNEQGEVQGFINRSGWYVCNDVQALSGVAKSTIVSGATGTFTGHKLTFIINTGYDFNAMDSTDYGAMEDIAAYEVTDGWACQGILGGSEYAWGGLNTFDPIGPVETAIKRTGSGTFPFNPASGFYAGMGTRCGLDRALGRSGYPPNRYSIGYYGESIQYDFNGGMGFYGGYGQASQNVPSYGGLNFTSPTRLTLDPLAFWYTEYGGWYGDDANTPAGIALQNDETSKFVSNPIANGHGGGMLRLNAPSSFGHAGMYFSQTDMTQVTNGGVVLSGDTVMQNPSTNGDAVSQMTATDPANVFNKNGSAISQRTGGAGWYSKSISVLFQSFYEQSTGKNSWDYCPSGTGVVKWPYGRNRVWPVHERVGTKMGYGPLAGVGFGWGKNFDETHTANHPQVGAETIKMGLTEVGCSPMWLDLQIRAWWPVRDGLMTTINFDSGLADLYMGRHSHNGLGGNTYQRSQGFTQLRGEGASATNAEIEWSTWGSLLAENDVSASVAAFNPQVNLGGVGFSKMWSGEAYDYQATPAGAWSGQASSNGWPYSAVGTNNVLWGNMGNWLGTGTPFAMTEGYHTLRTVFEEEGMTVFMDGVNKGKDLNSNDPIWGFSILFQKAQGRATKANTSPIRDNQGWNQWVSNPAYNKTSAALQIDELTIRHIPTDAMIPFPVDSATQAIAGVGKYTGLSIEVDNIKESKNMNVKVSICPVNDNIAADGTVLRMGEGGTPYSGFDKLSINAIGGFGSIDLTDLPADAITNGFVIRFHFYVPSAADSSLMPVDWSTTPVVKSWTLEYDLAPTSGISCIGNTYNGDVTAPIDTKVGHIVSFRGTATTADIDRTVESMKFDFGDGTVTDWLPFTDSTLQTNFYDTAHSYLTSGTFSAKAYAKDDAGNESEYSDITIVVINAAPVAVLRAVPSLIRAGNPVTFDASDSFDINAGASLASYTFTFGDGSGSTTNASGSAQHTFSQAGEYQATLVCVDNDGASSQTAIAIVKVLPATLVIPLVFNTKPRAFQRVRSAEFGQTPVLDAVYPELTDTGQRMDEFSLTGSFLTATANSDIEFVEELLISGSLVEFMWEDIDYEGIPSGKTFVGRIKAFDYNREGGAHGETPYTITLTREAGLGV